MLSKHPILFILAASFLSASANASLTKMRTGFQYDGAGAIEGEITFSPVDGGKDVKSSATLSFVGSPAVIEANLKRPWRSESELAELYLEPCVENGGKLVNVTVLAGTFEACQTVAKTPDIEITKWMGKVSPNGLIRSILKTKGVQTREELIEYTE